MDVSKLFEGISSRRIGNYVEHMMNTSEQVGFSLVLGVGRIDNNNYMDIYTTTRDVRDSFMMMRLRQSSRCSVF